MTAFFGGVAAWVGASALYFGVSYVVCWGYVGHWPVKPWVAAIGAVICGASHGAKAAKALWDA